MAYAYEEKVGKRTARARITGVNASYKDLCEVCGNVRGRPTEDAIEFLELAAKKKKAIRFFRHNAGKGHRRELGGKSGGFPVKSVKIVLEVVKGAAANALRLGMGNTKIAHIIANKQDILPRMSPKGRRIVHNYETAFVEAVLEEAQEDSGAKKGKKGVQENVAKKPDVKKTGAPKAEAKANEPGKAETSKASADAAKKADVPKAEMKKEEEKQPEVPKASGANKAEAPKPAPVAVKS